MYQRITGNGKEIMKWDEEILEEVMKCRWEEGRGQSNSKEGKKLDRVYGRLENTRLAMKTKYEDTYVWVPISSFSSNLTSKYYHTGDQRSTNNFWALAFRLQTPKLEIALRCHRLAQTPVSFTSQSQVCASRSGSVWNIAGLMSEGSIFIGNPCCLSQWFSAICTYILFAQKNYLP